MFRPVFFGTGLNFFTYIAYKKQVLKNYDNYLFIFSLF